MFSYDRRAFGEYTRRPHSMQCRKQWRRQARDKCPNCRVQTKTKSWTEAVSIYFLEAAPPPAKLRIDTNTLDRPSAMGLFQHSVNSAQSLTRSISDSRGRTTIPATTKP